MDEYTPTPEEVRDEFAIATFHTEQHGHVHDQVSDGAEEFERTLRKVKFESWAEGYAAGQDSTYVDISIPNPYRQEADHD